MKCVNEKCNKNPLDSINSVVINIDGDLACSVHCKQEYEKQRDNFFANIGDDDFFKEWINGKI
jgi:hypothetical protein